MSSADAASDSAHAVDPSPSAAEQPPAQSDPSRVHQTASDVETPTAASELDASVHASEPGQDVGASATTESSPSAEVLAGSTGPEHIEGGDAEHVTGGVDDSQQWVEDDSHELKRVKVYELIGSRWVDQGTAFCFGDFQDNEALLIARAEEDFNRIILTTTIRATDVYQRQQGA